MSNLLHFVKVFAICLAAAMVAYVFVVYRWGFGVSVGWFGTSRPPIWVLQITFWLWPVIPVFLIAGLWEIVRMVRFHLAR